MPVNLKVLVDQMKAAGLPVISITALDEADRSTWSIEIPEAATKEERAAAQAALDTFDPDAPENQPTPPRDLAKELDALQAAIIKKTPVTKEDIEREKSNRAEQAHG